MSQARTITRVVNLTFKISGIEKSLEEVQGMLLLLNAATKALVTIKLLMRTAQMMESAYTMARLSNIAISLLGVPSIPIVPSPQTSIMDYMNLTGGR